MKHPEARQPEYGIVIAKDVMIPMRDGIKLAAEVNEQPIAVFAFQQLIFVENVVQRRQACHEARLAVAKPVF